MLKITDGAIISRVGRRRDTRRYSRHGDGYLLQHVAHSGGP